MDIVENETQALVDYLNEWGSSDYIYDDLGDCGINATAYKPTSKGEKKFIKDALDTLDQNEGLTEYDNVILSHDIGAWGYGRSMQYEVPSGVKVHGCTVYSGNTYIGDWEIRGFVWHEAVHSYGADHHDGRYRLNYQNDIHGITPLCMSYLYNESDEVDTTWEGGGNIPYGFCKGKGNFKTVTSTAQTNVRTTTLTR